MESTVMISLLGKFIEFYDVVILANNQGLVIAYEEGTPNAHPDTDLRPSEKPKEDVERKTALPPRWRIFGKRK
jgi:hypothetical protein